MKKFYDAELKKVLDDQMKNKEFTKKYLTAKPDDIISEIDKKELHINDLISQKVKGKIKNVREIKIVKKDIARLKTILNSKIKESSIK